MNKSFFLNGVMFRYENAFTRFGLGVSTETLMRDMKEALRDDDVHIDLIIDSGGGVVNGVSAFADFIYTNRERITAYIQGYACSAAFWVASSCGKMYVEDTSQVGSVGVITTVYDDELLYENNGVIKKNITSTKSPNKAPDIKTEQGINEIKRSLDELCEYFINAVARNRHMSSDEIVKRLENGGVITGKQAVERNIADGFTKEKK